MAVLTGIKHIFFDLDDTLWDFRRNSGEVLGELFAEHGLEKKLGVDFATFHGVYSTVNLALWSRYYRSDITKEYLRAHRFNLVFNEFGLDDFDAGLRITEDYIARAPKRKHLKEGCIDLLTELKQRYQLHIITNGFKEIQATKIDGCSLRGYFSNIIISEEHGMVKPDVRIFRIAEKFSGAQPHECVMIGDSYESDIAGGLNAGWKVIHLSDEAHPEFTGPRISKLAELRDFFS
jgi:putative hydrolase of the HAD superfamily